MCGEIRLNLFKNKYKLMYPNSSINIIEEIKGNFNYVLVNTEFGICKIRKGHLLDGVTPSIACALNKNEYYKNKANKIHNNKYNYSLINYNKAHTKLNFICKNHGKFLQSANCHLLGQGCPECKKETISVKNGNNSTGWTLNNWVKSSKTSKVFDSYKCYIIECYNDSERFLKIGRTFKKINKRFPTTVEMPYNYIIIKVFIGQPEYIFNLETKLKNMNKNNKYLPKLDFNGKKECFININYIL